MDAVEQETALTEPEAGEAETKEQEILQELEISNEQEISDEQEIARTTEEQETTKKNAKPEGWPPRMPRSNSVAERAKMFEEKMSSPSIPPHSPRKPKIKLPTAEPSVSMEVPEGELINVQDPPLLLPPPSETPPPPPLEPPPLTLESPPPELEPALLELEPPSPPIEPPPPPPLEPQPPPLELLPSIPPESLPPPPPSSEPPLLEISQAVSPPMDQIDGDIQQRSSTMPASDKKKLIKKVTEK